MGLRAKHASSRLVGIGKPGVPAASMSFEMDMICDRLMFTTSSCCIVSGGVHPARELSAWRGTLPRLAVLPCRRDAASRGEEGP